MVMLQDIEHIRREHLKDTLQYCRNMCDLTSRRRRFYLPYNWSPNDTVDTMEAISSVLGVRFDRSKYEKIFEEVP